MVTIEAPKEGIAFDPYLDLDRVGDSIIHIFRESDQFKDFKGGYYSLSRHLKLDSLHGFFEGDCIPIKRDCSKRQATLIAVVLCLSACGDADD